MSKITLRVGGAALLAFASLVFFVVTTSCSDGNSTLDPPQQALDGSDVRWMIASSVIATNNQVLARVTPEPPRFNITAGEDCTPVTYCESGSGEICIDGDVERTTYTNCVDGLGITHDGNVVRVGDDDHGHLDFALTWFGVTFQGRVPYARTGPDPSCVKADLDGFATSAVGMSATLNGFLQRCFFDIYASGAIDVLASHDALGDFLFETQLDATLDIAVTIRDPVNQDLIGTCTVSFNSPEVPCEFVDA